MMDVYIPNLLKTCLEYPICIPLTLQSLPTCKVKSQYFISEYKEILHRVRQYDKHTEEHLLIQFSHCLYRHILLMCMHNELSHQFVLYYERMLPLMTWRHEIRDRYHHILATHLDSHHTSTEDPDVPPVDEVCVPATNDQPKKKTRRGQGRYRKRVESNLAPDVPSENAIIPPDDDEIIELDSIDPVPDHVESCVPVEDTNTVAPMVSSGPCAYSGTLSVKRRLTRWMTITPASTVFCISRYDAFVSRLPFTVVPGVEYNFSYLQRCLRLEQHGTEPGTLRVYKVPHEKGR